MRFNFDSGDLALDDDGSPPRRIKEEVEWVPLQSHPIFASRSASVGNGGGFPPTARNLLAWDHQSSMVYFWDDDERCVHRISVRFGEPDPSSILAGCPSKILRADIDVVCEIDKVSINKKGSALILVGSNAIYVTNLCGCTTTEDDTIVCRTLVIGPQLFFEGRDATRVLQASWHPYSDDHLGILFSDSVFRLFHLPTDVVYPEQEFYLQPVGLGRSRNAASIRAIAFCFGGDHMWERFSVFVLFSDGAIYILCPVAPFRSDQKWESVLELYRDAHAVSQVIYGLKSANSQAVCNSKMAIYWLEVTFPELAKQPEAGSQYPVVARPCALFDASLSLQGPLRKAHDTTQDLNVVECEGYAVSLLYNKVSKDSVLVTAWSSGQLEMNALADEVQPVWNLSNAPRIRVSSSDQITGLAMICQSTTLEQPSRAGDEHLEHTIWLGQPPPMLQLAIVDLALPRRMSCDAQIMMFVDSFLPERFYALHSWGLDSVVLNFLPFTSQATGKEEYRRTPSVKPIISTCLDEMPSASRLCGSISLSDSCGYSWLIGVSLNRDCIIVEMKMWDDLLPTRIDLTKEDFDLGSSKTVDTQSAISKELLSGPKVVILPRALNSRTLTADSIEGQSFLHQYLKLFQENYVEYAHKGYLEVKHRAPQLKRMMDDQQKRIGEARQRLLKVEDKRSKLDERIDRAIDCQNKLDQRLQSLMRLIGSRRKPLSRAEQEFKSELDYFMGVELEALRSSIEAVSRILRRYSQSPNKGLIRDDQVAQLISSLEKLCIVNKELSAEPSLELGRDAELVAPLAEPSRELGRDAELVMAEDPTLQEVGLFITPSSTPRLEYRSASASSSRTPRPQVYLPEIEDLVHQLTSLLQQESLTKDSFSELKKILDRLEGKILPQALGSACAILKTDFWQVWEEYEEACSHREALLQHIQSLESGSPLHEKEYEEACSHREALLQHIQSLESRSPLPETIAERTRLDNEAEEIQNELSLVDVEMAQLLAKRESLNNALAANQDRVEEVMVRLNNERREEEEKRRLFTLQRTSVIRLSIKDNIRQVVLLELNDTLEALAFCNM